MKGLGIEKKKESLKQHVNVSNNAHDKALAECETLKIQKQHVQHAFDKLADILNSKKLLNVIKYIN